MNVWHAEGSHTGNKQGELKQMPVLCSDISEVAKVEDSATDESGGDDPYTFGVISLC